MTPLNRIFYDPPLTQKSLLTYATTYYMMMMTMMNIFTTHIYSNYSVYSSKKSFYLTVGP